MKQLGDSYAPDRIKGLHLHFDLFLIYLILKIPKILKLLDGKFGAYMQVHIQNDGPVTIEIESPKQNAQNQVKKSSTSEEN